MSADRKKLSKVLRVPNNIFDSTIQRNANGKPKKFMYANVNGG